MAYDVSLRLVHQSSERLLNSYIDILFVNAHIFLNCHTKKSPVDGHQEYQGPGAPLLIGEPERAWRRGVSYECYQCL